jgi:acetylglutamate kinase
MKQFLNIVKIGGHIIDDPKALQNFLVNFTALQGPKILVHGGGKSATALSSKMGLNVQMIDGRRITDAEYSRTHYYGLFGENQYFFGSQPSGIGL